jgi:monofunctional biosynthetic peptidoglycan transglycosylase
VDERSVEPAIEIEADMTRRRTRGRRLWRWLWRGAVGVVAIALVPVILTLVYLPPAVHPLSTLMMKDLATLSGYDRRWAPLDEIGDRLVHSVMMSEDGQFCSHHGIDLGEFRVVIDDFLSGEPTRGGSTITMQTVKNLYLWHGRSYVRKAIELPYSIYLDLVMPKRRIMEIYLNIAEWGPGIYGAEAASQHHFGRPSSELTARQAALLAVTLPSPLTRTPGQPSASLSRLAATIERRAAGAGGYVGCLGG